MTQTLYLKIHFLQHSNWMQLFALKKDDLLSFFKAKTVAFGTIIYRYSYFHRIRFGVIAIV